MKVDDMTALELVEDLLDNSTVTDALNIVDAPYLRSVEDRARELRMQLILADPPIEEHQIDDSTDMLKPDFFTWMDK